MLPIDLNADDAPDLLVSNCDGRDVSVLLNNGDGTFAEPTDYAPGTICPAGLAVADLNGDSHVDVAMGTGSGIKTMMGNGDGTFAAAQQHNVGDKVASVATADMNADGYPEILLIDSYWGHNTLFVLPNRGNGEFGDPVSYNVTADLFGMTVGDLDGDGNADAVASGQAVSVLLGNGDGTLEAAVDYEVPANPGDPSSSSSASPTLGDWNHDGNLDLAVTTRFTDHLVLFAGQGDGTFSEAVTFNTSNWPKGITTNDFNGDGLPDLALTCGNANVVTVFLNAVDPPLVGDFDNDLDVDGHDFLIWQAGFGIQMNATHGDGDADGDSDIDGNDFLIWQASFGTGGNGLASGGGTAGAQLAALSAPGAAQEGLGRNSLAGQMLPPAVMAVPPVDASPMSVAQQPVRSASDVTPPKRPGISPQAADAWATTLAANSGTGRLPYAPRARASLADVSAAYVAALWNSMLTA